MLKGVNKQILEVTNTDNPYFEKIIFFVRGTAPTFDEQALKKEAEKISASVKKPPRVRQSTKSMLKRTIAFGISVLIGVGISMLIGHFA